MQDQDECQQVSGSMSGLYQRYAAAIFAYARLHTPAWEDAEDLTIEVFLAALEHDQLSWLNEGQQFVWLRRVAHNKLVDRYRRAPRCSILPLEQLIENVYRDEAPTPEQFVLRREELNQLHTTVSKLPVLQQQILQLRFGEGLPFAEIAVLLNKREEAVRKIASRTLARLRSMYHQQKEGGWHDR
ncbi:MAG TPA: sigma-70 family RNA polymerase sigma factor [Ktedonosporobacter sp.]|nr:sigma-70 family RNA polymerase sigma factor [Ktedonosporobacter sp.]